MKTRTRWKTFTLESLMATSLLLATAEAGLTQPLVLRNQDTIKSQPVSVAPSRETKQFVPNPAGLLRQGTQVSINGTIKQVAWSEWQQGDGVRTGISDTGLMATLGVELLNTDDYNKQPIQWFTDAIRMPQILNALVSGAYRYLDITDFARNAGWQLSVEGNTLQISNLPARVQNIRAGQQPWGNRLVVDLDHSTFWQISQDNTEALVSIEAASDSTLIKRFQSLRVESKGNKTTIRLKIPTGWRVRGTTIPNPNRLVIDIEPDAVVERDISWAPGLRWRQQFVSIGSARFPVVWLEINLRQPGISLKPILSDRTTLVGIASLVKTATLSQASAAVNAGFFNRKEQLPLGAVRLNSKWLSSPILNRGAIAWNDAGDVKIGHLSLQETVTTSTGESLPLVSLNSGYVQAGIARYTPDWGSTYTPLTDDEIIVVVRNNQVSNQMPGGAFGKTAFPIPSDGYILTIRSKPEVVGKLAAGNILAIESNTTPTDFSQYPHIIGAGPILLQNRQIVLDGKSEKFSDDFIKEKAVRSCIGTTASGNIIVATVNNRAGGAGPTLSELAQILQKMGAIDALNLDGGSSSSLYLGGQLINRSPVTASRVHNGIGIFLPTFP